VDEKVKELEARQVEVINSGEELLLKAKAVARKIQERVWRAMDEQRLRPPHRPARPRE
jgi:hypothetical protein